MEFFSAESPTAAAYSGFARLIDAGKQLIPRTLSTRSRHTPAEQSVDCLAHQLRLRHPQHSGALR
jgi:hypothetical protein